MYEDTHNSRLYDAGIALKATLKWQRHIAKESEPEIFAVLENIICAFPMFLVTYHKIRVGEENRYIREARNIEHKLNS